MKPSRKMSLFLFAAIILVSIAGFGFFFWYKFLPLQENIASLKQSISEEEALIARLGKEEENGEEILNQTTSLQERLPVAALVDQFILDLEKAEVSSGSLITSYSFNQNGKVNQESTAGTGNQQETTTGSTENQQESAEGQDPTNKQDAGTDQTNTENRTETKVPEMTLPEGVERLTVSMTVEAPDYFHLLAFIQAVEEFPRITRIDTLLFTGNREVRSSSTDLAVNKLVYSITVSTFYFPKLEELKDQLPTYETPPPANRTNPLFPFSITEEDEDKSGSPSSSNNDENEEKSSTAVNKENKEDTSSDPTNGVENETFSTDENAAGTPSKTIQKNGIEYKVYTYTVQPGDTLYSIALEKYNSKYGPQILQDWNGITPDELVAGKTIEIPFPAGNN